MTVKDIIKASGMSQNAFAELYGIPWRTVSNWCRGVNTCPDYVARLLEQAEETRKRCLDYVDLLQWMDKDDSDD